MKITRLLSLLAIFFIALSFVNAQDCRVYFPDRVGSVREMKSFDAKGKFAGTTTQEIIARTPTLNGLSIKVKTSATDKENTEVMSGEFDVVCEKGEFRIDMSDYLSQMLQAYQSMEVKLTGDNLIFPNSMKVGDVLPNANMNILVSSNGMQIMNMMVSITDRKVAARESITTEAGTFDCYKITSTSVSKTKILTITASSNEWIAEGVGMVKTESFDKKGKLTGTTELSRFVK